MLIVLHFCDKDGALALEDLKWARELDDQIDFECLLSYDETTRPELIRQCVEAARAVFKAVHEFRYPTPPVKGWPAAPNWAWQNTARYIPTQFKDYCWFWWEADAIPVRPGWCKILEDAYKREGKPFAGHIVQGVVPGNHMNGCGIYPNQVDRHTVRAFMCERQAWDCVMSEETIGDTGDLSFEIQHLWGIVDNKPHHTLGEPAHFSDLHNVYSWVDLNAAIVHRVKDDSLIKWLRHMRSVEFNVPQLCPKQAEVITEEFHKLVRAQNEPFVYPPTEIFIVSYSKDIPWLELCLRSIKKFCTGFNYTVMVVPERERHLFKHFVADYGVRLYGLDEPEGKGHLAHMAAECSADKYVMDDTRYVLHVDSDCIFKMPTTPNDFFVNGKPIYIIRTYESLKATAQRVGSDCIVWKEKTERALGFPVEYYTMCRHPTMTDLKVLPELRKWIEVQHGRLFLDWALDGQNAFPPHFAEYPMIGAFAYEFFRDSYHWIDSEKEAAPVDRLMQFWSHGGVTPQIRQQIESWLA